MRKHATKKAARAQRAAQHTEHEHMRYADDGGQQPAEKVTAPVTDQQITGTMPEFMQAMDFACEVGRAEGRVLGLHDGLRLPRNHGEARAKQQLPTVGMILSEVFKEVRSAITKHGPMHGGHEAYAVIKEELDEYFDEVRADRSKQASARTELLQVAAMAVRAILDTNPR